MKRLLRAIKKLNSDNSGVTLVELIVAVVVLSIAIGPLLYTFVFSTRFNGNSKIRQRSTSAAQTVIENFKASSVEEVNEMFQATTVTNPDGTTTTTYAKPFLRNNDPNVEYKFTYAGTGAAELGTYEINGMTLSDVATKESGKYDAVVEVTQGLTNSDMPDVNVFDPRQDAIWQETDEAYGSTYYDPYYVASVAVEGEVTKNGIDISKVNSVDISRYMQVIVDNASAYVQYSYVYTVNSSEGTYYGTVTRTGKPITGTEFCMNLRNVYFYYYPAYTDAYQLVSNGMGVLTSVSQVNVKGDYLYITNTGSDNINFFVYKQVNSVKSFFKLKTSENTYKLNVVSKSSSCATNVYDCVQANLADVMSNNYSTHMSSMLTTVTGETENSKLVLKDKVGPMDSSIMSYNINVKIYQHGDRTKVLSEMSATVLK